LNRIYEGMYLIDNAAVREDWSAAKTIVTDLIAKHGGEVYSARRWDERRLAYPIQGRNRATFLLTYYTVPAENIPALRRDVELNETIMRSLDLAVEAVPAEEAELAAKEGDADFKVPTPPDDDHIDIVETEEDADERPRARREGEAEKAEGDGAAEKGDADQAETETTSEEAVTASKED
jgi:small subunit ribosomal protein S6